MGKIRPIVRNRNYSNPKHAVFLFFLIIVLSSSAYIIRTARADSSGGITPLSSTAKGDTVILQKVSGTNIDRWQSVQMRVTAYCPCPKCCGQYSDGVTASGHEIQKGDTFAAADRKYPFRTELIIPGYNNGKAVKVLDRGGAIYENRLDVFFETHQQALEWGVRILDVKVHRN